MEKIKLYLANNLLNKLNPKKKFSFSLRFSLISGMFNILTFFLAYNINGKDVFPSYLLFPSLYVIISFILLRYYYKVDFKWRDYNIMGLLISIILNLPFILLLNFIELDGGDGGFFVSVFIYLFIVIITSLLSVIFGIFFEKTSVKIKLKRLISVILFVWALYKLITSFSSSKEEEVGFDTDGDGKIDTTFVDTDGDGIAETIAQDTDGDGIIDTVSSDTDGDGLIDTVVADIDGDGLADTIIKDVDIDGDGNSDFRVTKRKGKGLT